MCAIASGFLRSGESPGSTSISLWYLGIADVCCHKWPCVSSGNPNSNSDFQVKCFIYLLCYLPSPGGFFLFFIFHFKKPKTKETLWFFSSLKVLRDTDTIWTPFSSIVNQAVKKWQMLTQSRSNSLFQLWPRKAWPFTIPWPLSYSEPLEFWFEPLKRDLQSKALAWEQCCRLPPANCQAEKLFSVLVAASSEYQPRFWTRDRSIWQSQREKPSDSLLWGGSVRDFSLFISFSIFF